MSALCNTCKCAFESREKLMEHYKHPLHLHNLRCLCRHEPILTPAEFEELQKSLQCEEEEVFEEVVEEHIQDERAPIPDTECMFCGKQFDTFDLCFEHMTSHGFRIVYPDRLKDRDGLMGHLRTKVGCDHACILCWKRFKSLEAVRAHMFGKSHCAYDIDQEIEPFYEQRQDVVQAFTVDTTGELHTEDGKVYGHRKYARYYKQRPTDPEEAAKPVRQAITDGEEKKKAKVKPQIDFSKRKEKAIAKNEMRSTSKSFHPMSNMRIGNG